MDMGSGLLGSPLSAGRRRLHPGVRAAGGGPGGPGVGLRAFLRRTVLSVEPGDARVGVTVEQSVGGAEDARGEGREGGRVVEEVLPNTYGVSKK